MEHMNPVTSLLLIALCVFASAMTVAQSFRHGAKYSSESTYKNPRGPLRTFGTAEIYTFFVGMIVLVGVLLLAWYPKQSIPVMVAVSCLGSALVVSIITYLYARICVRKIRTEAYQRIVMEHRKYRDLQAVIRREAENAQTEYPPLAKAFRDLAEFEIGPHTRMPPNP